MRSTLCLTMLCLSIPCLMTVLSAEDKWPDEVVSPGLPAAYETASSAPKTQWPPQGKSEKLYFTQDDILSLYGEEKYTNCGQSDRLKLKGRQELFIFDSASINKLKGQIVTGALLHVKNASPDAPFYRVGVSSMATAWKEGSAKSMYQRIEGEVCHAQAELGKRDWAYPGSNVLDVIFGLGNTTWKFADSTTPDNNGWQRVAVDPKVVAARVAEISHGFAAYDENGNEWSDSGNKFKWKVFPNRFCYSRHAAKNAQPYLEVWTDGTDDEAPNPVVYSKVLTDGLEPGEAILKWIAPYDNGAAGTIGFDVSYEDASGAAKAFPRYLVPMARVEGGECRMHIQDLPFSAGQTIKVSIVPVDAAGNRGKAFTRTVTLSAAKQTLDISSSIKPYAASTDLLSVGGLKVGVADVLDKVHPVSGKMIPQQEAGYLGGNHIFSAKEKKIRLYAAKNEFVWFQLILQGQANDIQVSSDFKNGVQTDLYQTAYVGSDAAGNVPDPLLPLAGSFSIPSSVGQIQVKDQQYHSVLCEVYVPHKTAAGTSQHAVTIKVGSESLTIPVELNIWDFTLPNQVSFISEMNSYNFNLKNNYELHRMAHKYRLVLNQLPYGWSGGSAWRMRFNGTDFEGWDWFDKNMGPLLDGSAFKGLPRGEVPVPVLYTPLNENWPIKIVGNLKSDYWVDTALSDKYKEQSKKAYAAIAKYLDKKGYHDTMIEFYLNNKIYYRNTNTKSVCPWILDEPNNTQDFWALRYYGILFHEAVGPVKGKVKMAYRTDISYPEHGRETMWGICDRLVMGGAQANKIRQKQDEQKLWQENYLANYGSANQVDEPNTQPAAWSLLSWSQGATGVLPWQTIAKEPNWKKGAKTGLFYPHETGYKPSIRLMSFARGQQDIEYLTWYKEAYGADHFAVANTLNEAVSLKATIHKTNETDAGKIKFAQANPQKLWQFRVAVGEAVGKKKPAFKQALVDWTMPAVDIHNLPDIGHTHMSPTVKPHGPKMDSFQQR